jgi:predicted nucleic acid-binding protein
VTGRRSKTDRSTCPDQVLRWWCHDGANEGPPRAGDTAACGAAGRSARHLRGRVDTSAPRTGAQWEPGICGSILGFQPRGGWGLGHRARQGRDAGRGHGGGGQPSRVVAAVRLFVDTSVWYAAADRADRSNLRAQEILSAAKGSLVTTDHVLVETWLLLRHRLHRQAAEQFWKGLRTGVAIVESVVEVDLERAWLIGLDFQDQDFSLVDRTSFSLMERLGLRRVASFDDDFVVYRFGRGLREAFEVLR